MCSHSFLNFHIILVSVFIFVFIYSCVHECVCLCEGVDIRVQHAWTCVHMHMKVRNLKCASLEMSLSDFEVASLISLGLANQSRLSDYWILKIHFPVPPQYWDYREGQHTWPFLCVFWQLKSSPHAKDKNSTNWTIPSPPHIFLYWIWLSVHPSVVSFKLAKHFLTWFLAPSVSTLL